MVSQTILFMWPFISLLWKDPAYKVKKFYEIDPMFLRKLRKHLRHLSPKTRKTSGEESESKA